MAGLSSSTMDKHMSPQNNSSGNKEDWSSSKYLESVLVYSSQNANGHCLHVAASKVKVQVFRASSSILK
ncbi:hypothetical protein BgiBS90_013172 [Biomphalaria glabrata]|nr:hypothetical protein BgiBS90_013172 [Biomphalaria glabrata]